MYLPCLVWKNHVFILLAIFKLSIPNNMFSFYPCIQLFSLRASRLKGYRLLGTQNRMLGMPCTYFYGLSGARLFI